MQLEGKKYTRNEILERIGNISQLGGTRHYILNDGRSKGVSAIDVNTGSGLMFTVLPDRGLDISSAFFRGTNLVYRTQNGEVHPAFYESYGMEWLRTFFAGLLTTCGLTYLGSPGPDDNTELGLHGRYSASPACMVCDNSGWDGDDYKIDITGIVEECALFGDKVRLIRRISTAIGSKSITIHDTAENFGYRKSPFCILYHINPGFPLLDGHSTFHLAKSQTQASDEHSAARIEKCHVFSEPEEEFHEENFLHVAASDENGFSYAAMINKKLCGGLGLYVKFDASTLPYLNEWKMLGKGDYVVGMEPCNVPCENRRVLRESGMLQYLEPGEIRHMKLEIGVLDGAEEISSFISKIDSIQKER